MLLGFEFSLSLAFQELFIPFSLLHLTSHPNDVGMQDFGQWFNPVSRLSSLTLFVLLNKVKAGIYDDLLRTMERDGVRKR